MKKLKNIIIFLTIVYFINVTNVLAATNPYKHTSSFGLNCTWVAWDQVYNKLGIALPGWGNANTWYDYAKKAGFEVGSTPKDKSIVVWQWDKFGHVGYVERVEGDKIYVWDTTTCGEHINPEYDECIANGVSEETDKVCYEKYTRETACEHSKDYWKTPGDLIGYIYLDKIPKNTTSSNKNTISKSENTNNANKTPAKSNNAYLSKLIIDDINVELKKDIFEYKVELINDKDYIEISGVTEDDKATITGNEKQKLNVGLNEIKLTVTAEDGSNNEYHIQVIRKEQEETSINKKDESIQKDSDNKNTFKLISISLIIIGAISLIIILKKKIHKNK